MIGVLGKDPFGPILDRTVQGKTVKGRPIVVKRWKQASEIQSCQVLFICSSEKSRLKDLLSKLKGAQVLTVSEMKGFTESGGQVGFFTEKNRIRFEINQTATEEVRLKVSSQLLKLARIVNPKKKD